VEMVLDRPTTGVGAANFTVVQDEYARRSGIRPYEVLAPHNIYLEMAAEGGLPGLAAWVLFYGSAVFVALRAMLVWPGAPGGGHRPLEQLLAAGTVAALVAWAFASLFLHLAQFRTLLLVVALAVALDIRAAEAAATAPSVVGPVTGPVTRHARPPLRLPVAVSALAFAVALACALLVLPVRSRTFEGRARAAIVPAVAHRQPDAYEFDVASRRGVVDTYAAIVGTRRFRDEAGEQLGLPPAQRRDVDVAVRGSATSAIVDVSVRSPHRRVAASMAAAILERGRTYIDGLDRLYVLRPVTPAPATRPGTVVHPPALAVALLAAVAAALAAWAVATAPVRRRS
jgi:capsular polysaccharide biosynthesis protein